MNQILFGVIAFVIVFIIIKIVVRIVNKAAKEEGFSKDETQ